MILVFLDASALVAAIISRSGRARDLLVLGFQGMLALVCSTYTLKETESSLDRKAPHKLDMFHLVSAVFEHRVVAPPRELIDDCARFVHIKDAPIIAGAVHARATWIATYDRKHLLSQRAEILAQFGVTVATPDEILASLDR